MSLWLAAIQARIDVVLHDSAGKRVEDVIDCALEVVDEIRDQHRSTVLRFEKWVDPSLYALALARSPEPLQIDLLPIWGARAPKRIDERFLPKGLRDD